MLIAHSEFSVSPIQYVYDTTDNFLNPKIAFLKLLVWQTLKIFFRGINMPLFV